VNLSADYVLEFVRTAIANGFVDVVSLLFVRFSLPFESSSELMGLCAEHGCYEVLKIILRTLKLQDGNENRSAPMSQSLMIELLQKAYKHSRHQFVLDLLSLSSKEERTVLMTSGKYDLFVQLACMHVDVLRVLLRKYKDVFWYERNRRGNLLRHACQLASPDVVRELIDYHQDEFGDWTVDDFDAAALHSNVPVLRMLSLPRYGGCKKLVETPPLNRVCNRMVVGEMHAKSALMLMCCIKHKTKRMTMGKLQDVLQDLITGHLLRFEMK
jgi:hypothetical protein